MFEHYKKFFMSKTVILTVLLIMIGATLVSASLYFIFSRDNGTGEIVEEEQYGKERAEYGKAILKGLSIKLQKRYNNGFSVDLLEKARKYVS